MYLAVSSFWRPSANSGGPSLDLNFLSGVMPSEITFTRASAAWAYNSSGILTSFSTNTPRFEYDPVTLAPKGLLIEEARTNLALRSAQFEDAVWNKAFVTITPDAALAPDGTMTADLATASQAGHAVMQQMAVTASTTYTYSFWAKRGTATELKYSIYNLSNNSELVAPTSYYSQTNASTWSRISFTFTTPVGCTSVYICPERDSGVSGSVYLWGSQLELGSFATSYIPTAGSSVTRAADFATITSLSWYNATEGTMAVESIFNALMPANSYGMTVSFDDAGFNNRIGLVYNPDLQRGFYVAAGGVQQSSGMDVWNVVAGATTKQAFAYKANDLAYSYDGVAALTDSTATIPTVTTFRLGASVGSVVGSQYFRRLRYWKARKTNAELQGLTA